MGTGKSKCLKSFWPGVPHHQVRYPPCIPWFLVFFSFILWFFQENALNPATNLDAPLLPEALTIKVSEESIIGERSLDLSIL